MGRALLSMVVVLAGASVGMPAPYWIAYEGDDFPENVGWERGAGGRGGNPLGDYREIVDGQYLLLDSRRAGWDGGSDHYAWARPGSFDPGPGEYFVAEWAGWSDAAVEPGGIDTNLAIFSDDRYFASIGVTRDGVYNSNPFDEEGGQSYSLSQDAVHSYTLLSVNMRTYVLYVDGVEGFRGVFTYEPLLIPSRLVFGDLSAGLSSVSQWDYVRFGVVPEPGGASLMGLAVSIGVRRKRLSRPERPRHVLK